MLRLMQSEYITFARVAEELADLSRPLSRKYFRGALGLREKDDRSPVTRADQEIEETIRKYLAKRFPGHGVIGEEMGRSMPDAEYVWVIDPIDGTKAFATGKPLFGTLISLVHRGCPVVGLIDQAITGERWLGVAGAGAWLNGAAARVRSERRLEEAIAYTAAPEMFAGDLEAGFGRLRDAVKWCLYNCDCYAYGLLAIGQIDLVFERNLQPHDFCALVPIIANAGGFISDWRGRAITLESDGTIVAATSRTLAEEALHLLSA
jgi:inositol-phosphate phosphatase/L-galactose 1-phosphate phosphatase/histidinol-phosphatase